MIFVRLKTLADLERHVSNPEGGPYAIFSKLASGVGNEELLLKFDHEIAFITDVSKNYLFFTVNETQTGSDIWYLPLTGDDRTPKPFINAPFNRSIRVFPTFLRMGAGSRINRMNLAETRSTSSPSLRRGSESR